MSADKSKSLVKRPRKDTAARRLPSQSRSRKSVELCLKAAQDLLERDGIDGVTTRKIAQLAGVSVGTVYGYFPNKEAIIYRLGATWMDSIRKSFAALAPRHSGIPDAFSYFDNVLDVSVAHYESNIGLSTVIRMITAIPELLEFALAHDRAVIGTFAEALSFYVPRAEARELQAIAASIYTMVHAVLSDAIVFKTCDRQLALRNLRVSAYALISNMMVPLKDASR